MSDRIARQGVYELKRTLSSITGNIQDATAPVSDPLCQALFRNKGLDSLRHYIMKGTVLDTCAYAYSYSVGIPGVPYPFTCQSLQANGGSLFGVTNCGTYQPGTPVLVAINSNSNEGVILGALSVASSPAVTYSAEPIAQSTRQNADTSDKAILNNAAEDIDTGVRNFASGKFSDSTDVGEFGVNTITGTKLFVDPFMGCMATDDYTGLWCFESDSLTRLSGVNMQLRTSGSEKEYLNDEGEYLEYEGMVLHTWEQAGRFTKPDSETFVAVDEQDWKEDNKWKGYWEPEEIDAKPFHRITRYGGWIGQGYLCQVVAPDQEKDWSIYGEDETLPCLSRITQHIDGNISLESSKGITITKRGMFPGISRKARPDDISETVGDNSTNYKQKLKPVEIRTKSSNGTQERLVGIDDYLAYNLNYKFMFAAVEHENDYSIPEETAMAHKSSAIPDFNSLVNKSYITPEPYTLTIDEDRKEEYFENESGITFLPDGGVVLFGGCGEEIRLGGGCIHISAPGGIHIHSGRETTVWSGKDISIRAKQHIDTSSTEGSIRIKAEKHLEITGGNDGYSGVLIEGRGDNSYDFTKAGEDVKMGGVIIKASKGTAALLGETVYVQSGVNESGTGIVLNAGKGEQMLKIVADNVEEFVQSNGHSINFMDGTMTTVDSTTLMRSDMTLFPSLVTAKKNIIVEGNVVAEGNLLAGGHVMTVQADKGTIYVSPIEETTIEEFFDPIYEAYNTITETYQEQYDTGYTQTYTTDGQIGNDETLKYCEFTFRTDTQYKLPSEFALFADRWQNIAIQKGSTPQWVEMPVDAQSETTYPYPGKNAFTTPSCFTTQSSTLFDFNACCCRDRGSGSSINSEYNNPEFGDQEKKPLNSYPVIS